MYCIVTQEVPVYLAAVTLPSTWLLEYFKSSPLCEGDILSFDIWGHFNFGLTGENLTGLPGVDKVVELAVLVVERSRNPDRAGNHHRSWYRLPAHLPFRSR